MAGEETLGRLRVAINLDDSDMQKSIAETRRSLQVATQQFKTAAAGVDRFNASQEQLQEQSDALKRVLQLQVAQTEKMRQKWVQSQEALSRSSERTNSLKEQYEALSAELGENAEEVQRLKAEYQRSAQETSKLEARTQSLEVQHLRGVEAMRRTETQYEHLENAIENYGQEVEEVEEANEQSTRSFEGVTNGLKATAAAAAAAITAMIGLATAGLGFAVKSAVEFEQGLANVKSVSGATRKEMEKLHDQAIELGASTKYSANEVTKAQEELIKAGLSVDQVLTQGSGALSLATAGELELADAAEIAGVALNSFKKETLDMHHVADQLAGAANASATSVGELKYSMSAVATVAAGSGVKFDDLNTSLAVFANNGLKGSDAGTSLKTMLLNLSPSTAAATEQMEQVGIMGMNAKKAMQLLRDNGVKPLSEDTEILAGQIKEMIKADHKGKISKKDLNKEYDQLIRSSGILENKFFTANGELKSQAEIAQTLQDAMKGLTLEQQQQALKTMFGTDAIRAANIMVSEGAEGYKKMAKEISKVTAAEVAAVKLDTVSGAIEEMNGAIETLGIMVGEKLLPSISKAVKFLTSKLENLVNELPNFEEKIKLALVQLKEFGEYALKKLSPTLQVIKDSITNLKSAFSTFAETLSNIFKTASANTISAKEAIIIAVNLVLLAFDNFVKYLTLAIEYITPVLTEIADVFKIMLDKIRVFWEENGEKITAIVKKMVEIIKVNITLLKNTLVPIISSMWTTIKKIFSSSFDIVLSIIKVFISLVTLDFQGLKDGLGGMVRATIDIIVATFKGLWDLLKTVLATVVKNIEKAFDIDMVKIGEDIINGLIEGITNMAGKLEKKVRSLGKNVKGWLADVLDIHSPSRVLRDEIGVHLPTGIAAGINKTMPQLKRTVEDMGKMTIPNLENQTRGLTNTPTTSNHFNPQITIQTTDPQAAYREQQRLLRRMQFQGGF